MNNYIILVGIYVVSCISLPVVLLAQSVVSDCMYDYLIKYGPDLVPLGEDQNLNNLVAVLNNAGSKN